MAAITRKQFRDAVETLLEQQRAATPTLLRKTARHHPGSMGSEKPVAWQGEIADELDYTIGVRFRVMRLQVQIATTFPADLPTDDFDDLMDAILERFTLNDTIVPVSEVYLVGIEPSDITFARADGGADIYRGALLSVELRVQEGRN